jgi:hypothetical protein
MNTYYVEGYKIVEARFSNIYVIENFLEHDICDDIRNYIISIPLQKTQYTKNNNVLAFQSNTIKPETNDTINAKMRDLSYAMSKFNANIILSQNSGYILRKIYGPTRLHCDNIGSRDCTVNFIDGRDGGTNSDTVWVRNSTIIININDDYEGGIFNFPHHNIQIRAKKGSAIIFPPYWSHPHFVSDMLNGTYRYTITTWSLQSF